MKRKVLGIMKLRRVSFLLVAGILTLTVVLTVPFSSKPKVWYGYVVAEDLRVYMLNLTTGKIEWVSEEYKQMGGRPTNLEINREHSILYVGSDRGRWRWTYVPLIGIKLESGAPVVFESYVTPVTMTSSGLSNVSPVYYMILDSNSNSLYVVHIDGNLVSRKIVDPLTGELTGELDVSVRKVDEFSPDGLMVAQITPGRIRLSGDGATEVKGQVIVWDTRTGEEISRIELEDNQGLNPPWGKLNNNLVYIRDVWREDLLELEVHDRTTGKLLAKHDLRNLFGVDVELRQDYATQIPGEDEVAMSIGDSVIVFDPITAEVKNRIRIGDVLFTEVVVTDKPLIINEQ